MLSTNSKRLKKIDLAKLISTEKKMPMMMCGVMSRDRISSLKVVERVVLESIEERFSR